MTPELEVGLITTLVGAFLGVVGAYVFDIRKAQRERVRQDAAAQKERADQRATIATVLLEDLRGLELFFRQLYDDATPSRAIAVRPRLYFDVLRAETRWFGASSIYPLAETFHLVGMYYDAMESLRAMGDGHIISTPQREHELRVQAGFILQTIPAARAALIAEGAVLEDPTPELTAVNFPDLPPVPEPAFAKTRAQLAYRQAESQRPNV